mmetsp:Transcript_6407/g.12666  ORF Transcript_6407/g.12666 Transcript_6407/m.12666 type:complete len:231 (+) Transcript_6407:1235-1927(+)
MVRASTALSDSSLEKRGSIVPPISSSKESNAIYPSPFLSNLSKALSTQTVHRASSCRAGQSIMPATNSVSWREPSLFESTLSINCSNSSLSTSYPRRSRPNTSSSIDTDPEASTSNSSKRPDNVCNKTTEPSVAPASTMTSPVIVAMVSSWRSSAMIRRTSCFNLPYVANRCNRCTTEDLKGSAGAASFSANQGCFRASLAEIRLVGSLCSILRSKSRAFLDKWDNSAAS